MKKSLIWITAGIATVGFAVPAFAARGDSPEHIAPAPVTVVTAAPTMATSNTVSAAVATVASADDNIAHDATDDNGIDNTTSNSVDDNGLDDTTTNSVEDISGPCDEAEHATDPTCTGATAASTDDSATRRQLRTQWRKQRFRSQGRQRERRVIRSDPPEFARQERVAPRRRPLLSRFPSPLEFAVPLDERVQRMSSSAGDS